MGEPSAVGGWFLYAAPDEDRQGMDLFVPTLEACGVMLQEKCLCPERYYHNPFDASSPSAPDTVFRAQNTDESEEDLFVLHFYDMAAKKPVFLYKFLKVSL